jgi:hypothetical protein
VESNELGARLHLYASCRISKRAARHKGCKIRLMQAKVPDKAEQVTPHSWMGDVAQLSQAVGSLLCVLLSSR